MQTKIPYTKQDYINILSKNGNTLASEKIKKQALDFVQKNDFPSKKDENWRKTDLKYLLRHKYTNPEKLIIDENILSMYNISGLNANILIFLNGYFIKEYSKIIDNKTIKIKNIAEAKEEHSELFENYFNKTQIQNDNIFSALNTAFSNDGIFIYTPKNKVVENPIHIYNFSDGNTQKTISQSRNLIIADQNSQVNIIQSYHALSLNYTFANIATEIFVKENAHVNYNIFQGEGDDASQLNNTHVLQANNSTFENNVVSLCGATVRNDLTVQINGEGCHTDLSGLSMPDRKQIFDNTVMVHHNKPHSTSNQLYRGVIDNTAQSIFFGKVFVEKGAIKTFAEQNNNNILLTKYAKAHSKPQLEIYNDDVKCSHGSTIGQLDNEALFYMRTRGIGEKRAKILLLNAFTAKVLNKIKIEPYKNYVKFLTNKRLAGEKIDGLCYKMGECRIC